MIISFLIKYWPELKQKVDSGIFSFTGKNLRNEPPFSDYAIIVLAVVATEAVGAAEFLPVNSPESLIMCKRLNSGNRDPLGSRLKKNAGAPLLWG